MVDSNSVAHDGAYSDADQPQENCKGCSAPTPVDDLYEGYCHMCIAEDLDDLVDIEGGDSDEATGDGDSSLWGSMIA